MLYIKRQHALVFTSTNRSALEQDAETTKIKRSEMSPSTIGNDVWFTSDYTVAMYIVPVLMDK